MPSRERPPRATVHGSPGCSLLILCFIAGCAPGRAAQKGPPPGTQAARPAPPPTVEEKGRIESEEAAERCRQELDFFDESDARSGPLRRDLLLFYTRKAEQELSRGHLEDAFQTFSQAITLFRPEELQDPARPPRAPELHALARRIDSAFRRRGAHQQVITALMVQRTLAPGDAKAVSRYQELSRWLQGTAESAAPLSRSERSDPITQLVREPPQALIQDLEHAARLWPSRAVVQELSALYLLESHALGLGGSGPGARKNLREFLSHNLAQRSPFHQPAFKLARLYMRIPDLKEAVQMIRKLSRLSQQERVLLGLLESASAPGASPAETIKLAMLVSQNTEDTDIGLTLCRDLARRHRRYHQAHLCTGEMATQRERTVLAITAFERAIQLVPQERPIWERLGQLYVLRLSELVGDERTAELEGMLAQIERYQERMRRHFPGERDGTSMSMALAEVGRGYYNAGRLSEAQRFLERSIQTEPNSGALELLGTIQLKRGQARLALSTLERARAVEMSSQRNMDPLFKIYFRAHIGRLIADALDLDPQTEGTAADVRRASVKEWEQLLSSERLLPDRRAEAEMERGKLLYALRDREQALGAFRQAMDALPDEESSKGQGQVYADTISFLVQHGELEEALDAYHRALSRTKVSEYLKVYCSLWVNDLAARMGQPDDPLATAYLKSLVGGKWYAELARYATNQQDEQALFARADSVGKRAEANFYVGMRHLRSGNQERGEELLREVIKSDMMAFFEYDMAAHYLKRGAPRGPTIKQVPKAPPKKGQSRPAGSI